MADDTQKKESKTFLQKVGGVIIDFADWAGEKLGEERAFKAICDDMGLDVKKTPEFPKLTLSGIKDYVSKPNPGLEAWVGVIADLRNLYESIRSVIDAIDLGAEATAEETFQTFIDLLASNYVRDRWFHLYVWMEFARFSTEPMTLYGPQGTAAKRFYGSLKALVKFALAPVTLLKGPPMQDRSRCAQVVGLDLPAARGGVRVHRPFRARDRPRLPSRSTTATSRCSTASISRPARSRRNSWPRRRRTIYRSACCRCRCAHCRTRFRATRSRSKARCASRLRGCRKSTAAKDCSSRSAAARSGSTSIPAASGQRRPTRPSTRRSASSSAARTTTSASTVRTQIRKCTSALRLPRSRCRPASALSFPLVRR